MTIDRVITKSADIRVWFIENGANPGNSPSYQGLMKFQDPSQGLGDIEKIEAPDPNRAGAFTEIDSIQGAEERVAFGLMGRYPRGVTSDLKRLSELGCELDIQAHLGRCRDPQDFNGGWEKVVFFEGTNLTNYGIENFGAFESSDNAATNETADTSAVKWYERVRLVFAERGGTETYNEIVSIDVCDTVECGDCDEQSDGCSKVFAVQKAAGASPGINPGVIYSEDGMTTLGTTLIDVLSDAQDPSDSECVGGYFVVISNAADSYAYADSGDILLGTETWAEVTTGFVAAGSPNAIVSAGAQDTFIVGDGGYIYKLTTVGAAVTVQDAGVATTSNLNDVDAYDANNVVAVGNDNAIVYTNNGGDTWAAASGPVTFGTNLTAVAMRDADFWIVGTSAGTVYYTKNGGLSWTQVTLPVTATNINDIKYQTKSVGTMAVTISGPAGRMLGTIDGGQSWYVLPEGITAIPDNDAINQIAVCPGKGTLAANTVYAGGLADDGSDGILLKLS